MAHKDPEKKRAYEAAYRVNHPEKVRAAKAAFYIRHRKKILASHAAYRANNREKVRAFKAAYRAKHPEKGRADGATFRAKHPEKGSINHKAWRKTNPHKVAAIKIRRRAAKTNAPINDLTAAQWQAIKDAYGHRCVYCGRKMQRLTQDHITPLSKGGSHTLHNVVPACRSCNSKKGTRAPLTPVQPLLL